MIKESEPKRSGGLFAYLKSKDEATKPKEDTLRKRKSDITDDDVTEQTRTEGKEQIETGAEGTSEATQLSEQQTSTEQAEEVRMVGTEQIPESAVVETGGSPKVTEIKETDTHKLDTTIKLLSDVKFKKGFAADPVPIPPPVSVQYNEEALSSLVQTCKSIERLCELARMYSDPVTEGKFRCQLCSSEDQAGQAAGVFVYDMSLGVDFTQESQPQVFRNLKKNVARHLTTQLHRAKLEEKEELPEKERKRASKNQQIGIILGKQACKLLELCRPFGDYEIDVTLLATAGVTVGNLNYSWKFVSQIRPAFANAVDSRLKSYLRSELQASLSPPNVGIVADKMTTRRRTGHIHGAIVFTPGEQFLLTPVALGIRPVTRHSGDFLASEIKAICKDTEINDSQISAFGFDGQ